MLPSKDSDANDVIHEQQPVSIDEDRQEEPRISARTSFKDPRSYLNRRT